ncbi:MAG: AAA family ATPase [Alkalinema sp. RU_4_3]|nr:AAA family ATPase [Alkalinema sp. RU_4_3]
MVVSNTPETVPQLDQTIDPSLEIPGYQLHSLLGETSTTKVFRAKHLESQQSCTIKLLNTHYPSLKEIARLKHEAEITTALALPGIIRSIGWVTYHNGYTESIALVLEDFPGQDLTHILSGFQDISRFLELAICITTTIGELHAHHIIHKDIKPDNILYNPKTNQVKITDFGIASRLNSENPAIEHPELLEGTLAYISPEQTGRMNRSVDYRTDFYSLGVTFYQIITGQLPFSQTMDAMELVHCHIAKLPIPAHHLNLELPLQLSRILTKLLAKNAEDRYQTAHGLRHDLLQCQQQWEEQGQIAEFDLGDRDYGSQLQIPQKLYGRELEIATLLAAFDRTQQGASELVLVGGYSGIGKSAVIQEIHRPITQHRGYFISGKFDQFNRNIPYSALIQAFQELIHQLLTESEDSIEQWRTAINQALAPNAQVLIEVIPDLELIIGPQMPVLPLEAIESQNRFNLAFIQFIRAFASKPLVLFLDDLQWADRASLKLLQRLMSDPESRRLLCVAAYRDNEVDSTHPFILTLDSLHDQGTTISEVLLKPLAIAQIQQLLADTLSCNIETTLPLAQLLQDKTGGNPFFLTQLLKTIYRAGLLRFELSLGQWQWDMPAIHQLPVSENIVDLVAETLQTLPAESQHILSLSACVGNRFDLKTLSIISQQPILTILNNLWEALKLSLVMPLNSDYKLLTLMEAEHLPEVYCRFLHDRVQQAAYTLIPEDQKQQVHHQIGQLLLQATTNLEEDLFDIVNHLNIALDKASEQKHQLAQLNLQATQKAITASAYAPAINYATAGIACLEDWHHDDRLYFELYRDRIECEYVVGNFAMAEELTESLFKQPLSDNDKAEINTIRLTHYQNNAHYEKAIRIGLDTLRLFGLDLPEHPSMAEIQALFVTVEGAIGEPMDLLDAPAMTLPKPERMVSLLMNLVAPTYLVNQPLLGLIVLKMMEITLEHGNTLLSVFVYTWYGTILCGNFGDYQKGYTFGQLALKLNEKFGTTILNGKLYMSFGNFISHWRRPIQENLEIQANAYQFAKSTGDFSWCHHSAAFGFWQKFDSFQTIEQLLQDQSKYIGFANETEPTVGLALEQQRHLLLALAGKTDDRLSLSSNEWSETAANQVFGTTSYSYGLNIYSFAKMLICFTYGNYAEAYKYSLEVDKTIAAINAQYQTSLQSFYQALIAQALYRETPESNYLKIASAQQAKLQRWADNCPENFLAMYQLLLAETAFTEGNYWEAGQQYDAAIATAKQYRLFYTEALAHELAGRFYLTVNRPSLAQTYLKQAIDRYQSWGAIPKANWLQSKFGQYGVPVDAAANQPITTNSQVNALDFEAIIKSCQVLSSQIILGDLLQDLIKIVLEHAGAERAVLLTEQSDRSTWSIALEGIIQQNTACTLTQSSKPLAEALPESLLNYVIRTQECIVLSNALHEGRFGHDAYIKQYQCRSLLCMPLVHQGKIISLLYLENNLTNGAFTVDRLEVLKVLCSQAAISIEQAQLYNNLEQRIAERTIELEVKNQELEVTIGDLHRTQSQMIQTEKMSSLGQLVAGIAHEINNPINFIYGNIKHCNNYTQDLLDLIHLYAETTPKPTPELEDRLEEVDLPFLEADLPKLFQSIRNGAQRVQDIVKSLRTFSRLDEATYKQISLHDGIESTLVILQHRLKLKGVGEVIDIIIDRQYGDLPLVDCYAGQMNQVFMNILNNAIDSIEEKHEHQKQSGEAFSPKITILTEHEPANNQVKIHIMDNGMGIPDNIQSKIFDPFFTTKTVGQGIGLGLATSYQIITENHRGNLCCDVGIDRTTFVITIPTHE